MLTLLLIILYPLAIQIERKGIFYILAPITIVTLLIDAIANYTELALITVDFPKRGEYTFSTRLERLIKQEATPSKYMLLGKLLNKIAPSHAHIKAALNG